MADDSGEDKDEPNDALDVIWCVLGFVAGTTLSAKYVQSVGFGLDEDLPGTQVVIVCILLFGAVLLFLAMGVQLRKELKREKITWATYWTTLFSVAVASFTLLGITGIDDFFRMWNST